MHRQFSSTRSHIHYSCGIEDSPGRKGLSAVERQLRCPSLKLVAASTSYS